MPESSTLWNLISTNLPLILSSGIAGALVQAFIDRRRRAADLRLVGAQTDVQTVTVKRTDAETTRIQIETYHLAAQDAAQELKDCVDEKMFAKTEAKVLRDEVARLTQENRILRNMKALPEAPENQ